MYSQKKPSPEELLYAILRPILNFPLRNFKEITSVEKGNNLFQTIGMAPEGVEIHADVPYDPNSLLGMYPAR